jgi:hypothetical protein
MNTVRSETVRSLVVVATSALLFGAWATTTATKSAAGQNAQAGEPAQSYDQREFACGTVLAPEPLFIARVVHRTPDGSLAPVLGVQVLLETHGTVHASGKPTRIAITQDDAGRFSYRATLHHDSVTYYKEGVVVGRRSIDDVATFTIKARGCEPLRVDLTTPGEEATLEMNCTGPAPGRSSR